MARTMLLTANLQPKFWRKAVGTVVYTLNRTQLRPNYEKPPYELWKGRPASLKYFKIFGSKCFIKINDGSPGKFDSQVDEGLLEKEIEEHEYDSLIEEEEPKEEVIDEEEEEEEEEREPPNTPSKMKYVQRHHPEEQIISDKDEGVQTRRRITITPKRKVISLLFMIEP
eukprot:PITA_29688